MPGDGGGPKLSRRASLSASMNQLHDADPAIAGLGVDCFSRTMDETEIMEWCESLDLPGSANPARRTAMRPKPYCSDNLWKDEYQNFVDYANCNGWTKRDALPYLRMLLKEGHGTSAVEDWVATYGPYGTYDQLVRCATYLYATIVKEDPWLKFTKRTQKPNESPKMFGLELQRLLVKARPSWRKDDEYFIEYLFHHFTNGLLDDRHRAVVWNTWEAGTSLADMFLAIDQFDRKIRLFGGKVPPGVEVKINAVQASPIREEQEPVESIPPDDSQNEEIGAVARVQYSRNTGNQNNGNGGSKPKNGGYNKPPTGQKNPLPEGNGSKSDSEALIEALLKKLTSGLRRPQVPKSEIRCYRCQVMGHYASECEADKPVYRQTTSSISQEVSSEAQTPEN